jgi:hypothetical protein
LVAAAEIEFCIAEIEIAIGKDQRVTLLQVFVTKECGVVAAASEG